MALVLKKFHIGPSLDQNGPVVEIQGRQPGIIGFILSILNLDDTTSLICYSDRIEYKSSSFWGEQALTIPAAAVTGIIGGFKKPLGYLIAAIFVFIIGLVIGNGMNEASSVVILLALFISAILVLLYYLKKEMNMGVQNGGDKIYSISFNRSVIENIDVDIDKVKLAISMINQVVLISKRR